MSKLTTAETEVGGSVHAFSMFPPEVAKTLSRLAVHRCWSNGSIVLPAGRVVPLVLTLVRGRLRMGIGVFAPPLGIGYFISCAIGKVAPAEAMRPIWLYLGALLAGLLLVAAVPSISTGFL